MKEKGSVLKTATNRRSFFKNGMVAAGAATMGAGLLSGGVAAFGHDDDDSAPVAKGDIAILRFLNALEQVEADLWLQYSELGGTQDNEVSGVNGGNALYTAALQILDGDMAQPRQHRRRTQPRGVSGGVLGIERSRAGGPLEIQGIAEQQSGRGTGSRTADQPHATHR